MPNPMTDSHPTEPFEAIGAKVGCGAWNEPARAGGGASGKDRASHLIDRG
jgi:hypothetical protein